MIKRLTLLAWILVLAAACVAPAPILVAPEMTPDPELDAPLTRSYGVSVYREQGGNKLVIASGGELEVQSGGTLDVQSGASTDYSGGVDLDGANLVIDADGDSIIAEASDDLITLTPGAATGAFEVRTGNFQVGNGTPGETHDGEDLYVEGISEFDGSAYFDGAVDMDSTLDVSGAISDGGGDLVIGDNADITGTLQYGADDLYPVGYASSGQQAVYGTTAITGTATAAHGLTTVTFALCTLGKQQDANTAGCSLVVNSNTVTLYTYEDDNTTQSTEASVPVHWLVIGAP